MKITIEMLKANPKLATQDNYDNEKNETVRREMLKANPELATQKNFYNEDNWYLRRVMIYVNNNLATQNNYNKANKKEDGDVRRFMKKINPALKDN